MLNAKRNGYADELNSLGELDKLLLNNFWYEDRGGHFWASGRPNSTKLQGIGSRGRPCDLGDQDVYSIMAAEHPNLFRTMSCGWNYQVCDDYVKSFEEKNYTSPVTARRYLECKDNVFICHENGGGRCGSCDPVKAAMRSTAMTDLIDFLGE